MKTILGLVLLMGGVLATVFFFWPGTSASQEDETYVERYFYVDARANLKLIHGGISGQMQATTNSLLFAAHDLKKIVPYAFSVKKRGIGCYVILNADPSAWKSNGVPVALAYFPMVSKYTNGIGFPAILSSGEVLILMSKPISNKLVFGQY